VTLVKLKKSAGFRARGGAKIQGGGLIFIVEGPKEGAQRAKQKTNLLEVRKEIKAACPDLLTRRR